MNLQAVLHQSPLFAGLTSDDLERLLAISRLRPCEKGELLFSQGEPAEGFFVVVTGKVKIYRLSPDGKERILHIVHPGESFAEAAIFADGRYPAFAEPLSSASVIFFPKRDFLALLKNQAQIAINMIGGLSRFLRQFAAQIEELTFKDVPARLARYLLDLAAGKSEVELPISKSQLASRLGTVSETLSRTLRKLSEDDLITVNGKQITIHDRERLEALAETVKGV